MVDTEKVLTRQLITKWYERARIDYSDLYVKQYIAYNAWFRRVTRCNSDHEAIQQVTKRFIIWDDYIHGRTLTELGPILEKIVQVTASPYDDSLNRMSDVIVKDVYDWRGLIAFWYQTRCDLFHGVTMPGYVRHDIVVKLAYESLSIFMGEIIRRMRYCFTDADFERLAEVKALLKSQNGADTELQEIEARLYRKFIHSPDIWNVDMERV